MGPLFGVVVVPVAVAVAVTVAVTVVVAVVAVIVVLPQPGLYRHPPSIFDLLWKT